MKQNDLTEGSIPKTLLLFAVPFLAANILQSLYGAVDLFVVGKYCDAESVAAVSTGTQVTQIVTSLITGLTLGSTILIGQYMGCKKYERVKQIIGTTLTMFAVTAVLLTIGMLAFQRPLLTILNTPQESFELTVQYVTICSLGNIFICGYNAISAVLRGYGDSVRPMIFVGIACVLNVVLDVLLVAFTPLGVGGAAIATVLAQLISGAGCLLYAWKLLPMLRFKKEKMKLNREVGKQVLKYGLPAAFQMSIISVSDMTLQAVVNTYGTTLVVAYGVCVKVEGLGMQVGDALGSALGTFTGQNAGAKNIPRIKAGFRTTFIINAIGYAVISPLIFILAPWIMRLFTDNTEAIGYGVEYMRIFAPCLIGVGILVLFHNLLRSVGDVKVTICMGVSEVITRIGFAFLFSWLWGYYGLWFVSPITWWCAAGVGGLRYISGVWKRKVEMQQTAEKICG